MSVLDDFARMRRYRERASEFELLADAHASRGYGSNVSKRQRQLKQGEITLNSSLSRLNNVVPTKGGNHMAKRKKESKVQKRAKLRRGSSAKRVKARKVAKSATKKRTVAKAKPKRAPLKKAARKSKQQPIAPVVETVVVDLIEQPAPGVITVTEIEDTEVRKAS